MEIEKYVRTRLPKWFVEEHVKTVVNESLKLSDYYPEADKEIAQAGAWLHDIGHEFEGDNFVDTKGYDNKNPHHINGIKIANEFLNSINFPKEKIEAVTYCIESHRTSKPPEPETIEAKIVASADNLAHFIKYDVLVQSMGTEDAHSKLERNLNVSFMLPEAVERANGLMKEIKEKRGLNK